MFREVNITDSRTVYLNREAIAIIENGDGGRAHIRLVDGAEFQTNEDYEEFLELFGIVKSAQ